MPSAMSISMGSITSRSAPVRRSRRKRAVRGPSSCPLNAMVPSGMRRAKASQRPSGDASGAMAPPLEPRYCSWSSPAVTWETRPEASSSRRICHPPLMKSSSPVRTW